MGGHAVLKVLSGTLHLASSDEAHEEMGWFEPRGNLRFSPTDQIVVEATLSGKGRLAVMPKLHFLSTVEMQMEPEMTAFYTCRMIDTPTGNVR